MSVDPASSSSAVSPEASAAPAESPPVRRRPRGLILIVVALVLGPVIYREYPREMARWRVAAALNARSADENEKARKLLDEAFAWDPENRQARLQQARWQVQDEQLDEALATYDQLVEESPADTALMAERADAYLRAGKPETGIEVWKELEKQVAHASTAERALVLNGLAYFRAVGNIELDEALEDIELAIKLIGEDAAKLDTRGYVHYRRGDYQAALADLDPAVKDVEQKFTQGALDAHTVAVIHYHRGLVHQALEDKVAAEADFDRVRSLGFEPNDRLY